MPPGGLDRKGMYNLYPPFAEFRITLFHTLNILLGILGIGQGKYYILNNKPPFVVVKRAANLLAFEDYKM